MTIVLPLIDDFDLDDPAAPWSAADWQSVPPTDGRPGHATRFRALYSATGLYVGFDCQDGRIVTTGLPDGGDLWEQDVVEAFFWPDETRPLYLEYELSPAGAELLLLVPTDRGQFMGWSPWHFEGERKTRKAVRQSTATHWSAEFYLPFALFKGICLAPPAPGTAWRANFCRIDHDLGTPQLYSWSPGIDRTFHDLPRFGCIRFGSRGTGPRIAD